MNYRRKHGRSWKHAGACGERCKPWKYGNTPIVDRMRASDRRRSEAAQAVTA